LHETVLRVITLLVIYRDYDTIMDYLRIRWEEGGEFVTSKHDQ